MRLVALTVADALARARAHGARVRAVRGRMITSPVTLRTGVVGVPVEATYFSVVASPLVLRAPVAVLCAGGLAGPHPAAPAQSNPDLSCVTTGIRLRSRGRYVPVHDLWRRLRRRTDV